MTSNDSSLVVEINGEKYIVLNDKLQALENSNRELHAELREIHSEIRIMSEELHMLAVRVNAINDRIDDMKFYVSLTFGALAVFVGLAALVPVVSKFLQSLRKPAITPEQINSIVDEAVARALTNH